MRITYTGHQLHGNTWRQLLADAAAHMGHAITALHCTVAGGDEVHHARITEGRIIFEARGAGLSLDARIDAERFRSITLQT
jgi:hypothetical protein